MWEWDSHFSVCRFFFLPPFLVCIFLISMCLLRFSSSKVIFSWNEKDVYNGLTAPYTHLNQSSFLLRPCLLPLLEASCILPESFQGCLPCFWLLSCRYLLRFAFLISMNSVTSHLFPCFQKLIKLFLSNLPFC